MRIPAALSPLGLGLRFFPVESQCPFPIRAHTVLTENRLVSECRVLEWYQMRYLCFDVLRGRYHTGTRVLVQAL